MEFGKDHSVVELIIFACQYAKANSADISSMMAEVYEKDNQSELSDRQIEEFAGKLEDQYKHIVLQLEHPMNRWIRDTLFTLYLWSPSASSSPSASPSQENEEVDNEGAI